MLPRKACKVKTTKAGLSALRRLVVLSLALRLLESTLVLPSVVRIDLHLLIHTAYTYQTILEAVVGTMTVVAALRTAEDVMTALTAEEVEVVVVATRTEDMAVVVVVADATMTAVVVLTATLVALVALLARLAGMTTVVVLTAAVVMLVVLATKTVLLGANLARLVTLTVEEYSLEHRFVTKVCSAICDLGKILSNLSIHFLVAANRREPGTGRHQLDRSSFVAHSPFWAGRLAADIGEQHLAHH
jgi:hypothetical protein